MSQNDNLITKSQYLLNCTPHFSQCQWSIECFDTNKPFVPFIHVISVHIYSLLVIHYITCKWSFNDIPHEQFLNSRRNQDASFHWNAYQGSLAVYVFFSRSYKWKTILCYFCTSNGSQNGVKMKLHLCSRVFCTYVSVNWLSITFIHWAHLFFVLANS